MVYALNVFNLLSSRENDYKDYSIKAGKIIYGKGGRVIVSGWKPIRKIHGDTERKYMIVVDCVGLITHMKCIKEMIIVGIVEDILQIH